MERVRRCEVQHGTSEDEYRVGSSSQQPVAADAAEYANPMERYGIPRLIISPPDEDALL